MLSETQLLDILLDDVWQALPPIKRAAAIASIGLADLGAVHGTWNPDTHVLTLNPVLFVHAPLAALPLIDAHGNAPAQTEPWVSRAYHTLTHECLHAIGTATGLDQHPEYLALAGWVEASDDPPGTGRYWERRPGWEQGPSAWRYRQGTWFVRDYATKSPYEAFADACTHLTLGWDAFFTGTNGQAQRAWLRRHVFEETGGRGLQARVQRWGASRCQPSLTSSLPVARH